MPMGGTYLTVLSRKYVAIASSGWLLQVCILPARYLEAMRGQHTLALNILKAFQDGSFTVRQTEGRFNGVWIYMALQQTYKRDAKTKSFTGISQQQAAISHGEIRASSSSSDSRVRADKGNDTLGS